MDFLNRLFGKDSEKAKTENPPLIWFEHLPPQSTSVAGNKGASLADLTHAGFPVPAGFIVPASAFRTFLAEMGGTKVILQMMGGVDLHTESQLRDASSAVRDFVLSKPMPKLLDEAIARSYEQLGKNVGVAVRSSPVNVDAVPGKNRVQQETFLNIRGGQLVSDHVRECWASFFNPRAIFQRAQKGALADGEMAVVVQQMVRAEKSGTISTMDSGQAKGSHMLIEAAYGLGMWGGAVKITPNRYVIHRTHATIVDEQVAPQPVALVSDDKSPGTYRIELPSAQASRRVLTDSEIQQLHQLALKVESHFGSPQMVEWAMAGGQIYLLQSRSLQ